MTDDVLTVFALLLVTFPQTGAAAVGNDAVGRSAYRCERRVGKPERRDGSIIHFIRRSSEMIQQTVWPLHFYIQEERK